VGANNFVIVAGDMVWKWFDGSTDCLEDVIIGDMEKWVVGAGVIHADEGVWGGMVSKESKDTCYASFDGTALGWDGLVGDDLAPLAIFQLSMWRCTMSGRPGLCCNCWNAIGCCCTKNRTSCRQNCRVWVDWLACG